MVEIYPDQAPKVTVPPINLQQRITKFKNKKTISVIETGTVHIEFSFKLKDGKDFKLAVRGLRYQVLSNKKVFSFFPYGKDHEKVQYPLIDFMDKELFKKIRNFINNDISQNL